ncbi:hypothetical protein [Streptomyces sp. NPDC003697]
MPGACARPEVPPAAGRRTGGHRRGRARRFIEDAWGQFDNDHIRPGAPLFPSERKNADGSARRVGDDALRNGLDDAVEAHTPGWADKLTPRVLRHFCASEL